MPDIPDSRYTVQCDEAMWIAHESLAQYNADLTTALADPDALGFLPGQAYDETGVLAYCDEPTMPARGYTPDQWTFPSAIENHVPTMASVTVDTTQHTELRPVEHESWFGNMLHKVAEKAIEESIKEVHHAVYHKLMHMLETTEHTSPGAYRIKAIILRNSAAAKRAYRFAAMKLAKVAQSKSSRRTGVQLISTTSKKIPKIPHGSKGFVWFKFGGKWAFRTHPGREALPKTEWVERYKKRLDTRSKTGRKRKGKGVTVPKTKFKRPKRKHDLSAHKQGGSFYDDPGPPKVDFDEFKPEEGQ